MALYLYLLERLLWLTMHERCRLICVELGQSSCGYSAFIHNDLVINKFPWSGDIMIFVKGHVVYSNGWADGIKKEYKLHKQYCEQFIKALDSNCLNTTTT